MSVMMKRHHLHYATLFYSTLALAPKPGSLYIQVHYKHTFSEQASNVPSRENTQHTHTQCIFTCTHTHTKD